jgi:HTH-type transcriptional regulator/antitoxin HigA
MEGIKMSTNEIQILGRAWTTFAPIVYVPHTEEDYNRLVNFLDELIDQVGEDESHPLVSMMEVIGTLIEKYEDAHVPELT